MPTMFRRHKQLLSSSSTSPGKTGASSHHSLASQTASVDSSTRVAINTSRASASPGTLELTHNAAMVQDSFVQQALESSMETCRVAYACDPNADDEDDEFSMAICSNATPTITPQRTPPRDMEPQTTPSHASDAALPPPGPLTRQHVNGYQPLVSPKSVLENIERRAHRRRAILQHTLSPGMASRGDGASAVPSTITSGPNREERGRARPPSPISVSTGGSGSANLLRGEQEDHGDKQLEATTPGTEDVILYSRTTGDSANVERPRHAQEARHKNRLQPPSPPSVAHSNTSKNSSVKITASRQRQQQQQQQQIRTPSVATTALHSNAVLAFWQDRITERTQRYGSHSYQTVQAWMDLGHVQFRSGDYRQAAGTFSTTVRLTKARGGLPAAQALHFQGTATSRAAVNHDMPAQAAALALLEQALEIRQSTLGEDHPDSVATQNSMAWVYYYRQQHRQASETFWYVFWKRQALFGPRHPAVAVSATDLARTFRKLHRQSDAHNFYSIALQIYDQMNVPASNSTVQRLWQELKALELSQNAV